MIKVCFPWEVVGGKVHINHQLFRDVTAWVQTASQASDRLSFSMERMIVPEKLGCWLQFSGDLHILCAGYAGTPKTRIPSPESILRTLQGKVIWPFRHRKNSLTNSESRWWKQQHLIKTGKGVPHTLPALLWGNTEFLSALMPQKFVLWDRMEGDMENMTVGKKGS